MHTCTYSLLQCQMDMHKRKKWGFFEICSVKLGLLLPTLKSLPTSSSSHTSGILHLTRYITKELAPTSCLRSTAWGQVYRVEPLNKGHKIFPFIERF